MAVKRHTSLKAQGITGSQTSRSQPERLTCGCEGLPQFHGISVRHEQLETVLAGVAGACQQHVHPGDGNRHRSVVFDLTHRVLIGSTSGQQNLLSTRTLHSNQGGFLRLIDELHIKIAQALTHGGEIFINIGGIGHHQELLVTQTVGDEVVNNTALIVHQDRVLGAARLQDRHVGNQRVVKERCGVRPAHTELAHMGEVKDTGAGAHSLMLGNIVSVLERHIPATEVGERGTQFFVDGVQGGFLG